MKKSIQKPTLVSLLVILLLFISVIGGCSPKKDGQKDTSTPKKDTEKTASQKDKNEDKPMEIAFFHGAIENAEYDSPIVKQLEADFNVKVEFIPWPDDRKEWLNLQIASGQTPDIIRGVDFPTSKKYVEQGIVLEVSEELIKEKAPKLAEWFERAAGKDAWNYYKLDGKGYAVPNVWELASNWLTLGARIDWLEEVGYNKEHLTIEEFDDAMRKIKKIKGDKVYPITGDLGSLDFVFGAFNTYPGCFTTDENDKIVLGETLPGAKKALEILHGWYKDGILDPEFVISKGDVVKEKFLAEKTGFTQFAYWEFIPNRAFAFGGGYKEALEELNPNANVGVIHFPKGPEGHYGTIEGSPVLAGVMFSSELADQPEKVAKYLEIFDASFDPEVVTYRYKGKEGVTYEITENGYEWIPPYDDEKKRIEYGIGTPFPQCFNDYAIQSTFNQLPEYKHIATDAQAKGVGKFDILKPIQRPIYSEKWTQLTELRKMNFVKFITGERSLDEYDQFLEEWKAAGGEAVLTEAQETYENIMK